jgi:hypothetical protein
MSKVHQRVVAERKTIEGSARHDHTENGYVYSTPGSVDTAVRSRENIASTPRHAVSPGIDLRFAAPRAEGIAMQCKVRNVGFAAHGSGENWRAPAARTRDQCETGPATSTDLKVSVIDKTLAQSGAGLYGE